jgi:hypothetical protein
MEQFLGPTEVIDFSHPAVRAKAQELSRGAHSAQEIAMFSGVSASGYHRDRGLGRSGAPTRNSAVTRVQT